MGECKQGALAILLMRRAYDLAKWAVELEYDGHGDAALSLLREALWCAQRARKLMTS